MPVHRPTLIALVLASTASGRGDELTFSPIVNVSDSNDPSQIPSMAMGGGGIYIAWLEQVNATDYVYFSRSLDLGRTFSTPVNLSKFPGGRPAIAATDFGEVFLMWPGFFTYSVDRGATFAPKTAVRIGSHSIACDELGTVHVAWAEPTGPRTRTGGTSGVFYSQWNRRVHPLAGRPSFSEPVLIAMEHFNSPAVASRPGGGACLALTGAGPKGINDYSEIWFTQTRDGISFDPLVNLSHTPLQSTSASVATDPFGIPYVVWNDSLFADPEVWMSVVTGPASSPRRNVSDDPERLDATSGARNVVVDPLGVVTVLWQRTISGLEIVVRRSLDGGRTFDPTQVIPVDYVNGAPTWVTGAVDSKRRIAITWQQGTDIFSVLASPPPFGQ